MALRQPAPAALQLDTLNASGSYRRLECFSFMTLQPWVVALLSGSMLVLINVVAVCWARLVQVYMGDCLWVGIQSQYITSHRGQLSLPSLRGRFIEYQPLGWG